jgi:general secretion pathway protein A
LTSKPFQLNPDPKPSNFYFGSKQHRRAKAYLEYGVSRNEGFIVITGEIGAGKTTVLRALIEGLHGSNVITGHLVTTQLGAEDTLRMVGAAFGFKVKDVPKSELLITLEAFLISQTSKGKRCLLIVDEAQNLTPRAVEELRMLSNFQFGNQALLQTFLVGQPEFREILQRPEMEQFRQRVAATCHIGPLDQEETSTTSSTGSSAPAPPASPVSTPSLRGHLQGQRRHPAAHQLGVRPAAAARLPGRQDASGGDRCRRGDARARAGDLGPSRSVSAPASADGANAAWRRGHRPRRRPQKLKLDPAAAEAMSKQLASLGAEQRGDQLQRLERSLLRLERINVQTLGMLQKLVGAVKKSSADERVGNTPYALRAPPQGGNASGPAKPVQATGLGPVMCVVGRAPNFMKMAPILRALAAHQPPLPALLVHTGQHYDQDMNDRLFVDLGCRGRTSISRSARAATPCRRPRS